MLREAWHLLRFFRAESVCSRDELDAALKRAPRYIMVKGTEALRAHAASLAYRGGQEAAEMEAAEMEAAEHEATEVSAAMPAYIAVPTIGRIRDGYRQRGMPDGRRQDGRRTDRLKLQPGMGTVLAAVTALLALLGAEWLLWPSSNPELVRGPHRMASQMPPGASVPLPTHAPLPLAPSLHEQMLGLRIPLLVLVSAAAMAFLIWQAVGPGRPARVSWRVAHRVQGLLVIARVRTRTA